MGSTAIGSGDSAEVGVSGNALRDKARHGEGVTDLVCTVEPNTAKYEFRGQFPDTGSWPLASGRYGTSTVTTRSTSARLACAAHRTRKSRLPPHRRIILEQRAAA
jgi:hypothetical protein